MTRAGTAIESLIRHVDDNAQFEERPRPLEALAACRPLGSVQWAFVVDAIAAVRMSVEAPGMDWTETVEQALSD